MRLSDAERRLVPALAAGLPGAEAHLLLAPRPRLGWRPGEIPAGARAAAALVLLYPGARGEARFVLTLRPSSLARHGGQVSLPGGSVEPGESVEETALREAREEIGADADVFRVLGRLSPLHVPVSGFVIHPVLAFASLRGDLRPSDGEVAAILEIPLRHLLDPASLREERRTLAGQAYEIPFFHLGGHKVWGATAMILSELVWLLRDDRC